MHMHWSKQLKDQPVLLLSSFVHNSSIGNIRTCNEEKTLAMKGLLKIYVIGASERICKWNSNEFFLINYLLRKGKVLFFLERK